MQSSKKSAPLRYIEGRGLSALPHNLYTDFVRNKTIWFMAAVVVAWYLLFCYAPMSGLIMAFQDFKLAKGFFGSKWVGLLNFERFFTGPYFGRLLRNTALLGLLELVINFPASIIFALLLNEIRAKRFKKTVQTISYMPYFISMVVMCGIIKDFLEAGGVLSNMIASLTGGSSVNLLGVSEYFRTIFTLSGMWQGLGYGSIIYLAALSNLDQELYEAAQLDGANRWKQTLHITLPGLLPTITIMLIMKMGTVFSVNADKIMLLYSPATYETADVINTYVYRVGLLDQKYSFSTAVGLFNSLVGTVFLLTTNAFARKFTETSLF